MPRDCNGRKSKQSLERRPGFGGAGEPSLPGPGPPASPRSGAMDRTHLTSKLGAAWVRLGVLGAAQHCTAQRWKDGRGARVATPPPPPQEPRPSPRVQPPGGRGGTGPQDPGPARPRSRAPAPHPRAPLIGRGPPAGGGGCNRLALHPAAARPPPASSRLPLRLRFRRPRPRGAAAQLSRAPDPVPAPLARGSQLSARAALRTVSVARRPEPGRHPGSRPRTCSSRAPSVSDVPSLP